ncbi:MAG TPA: beta-N-acetylhexosaminidase [Gammaproteobacteria bacterium]|nr:beta-N-acetylhexosaminidase [Gammaproteobacteria bacterium]
MLGPLIVDVAGTSLDAEDRELLAHPLVGGVILFARNCRKAAEVARLAEEVHALRKPPLLVTIDQEGGRVQRLTDDVTRLPPASLFGALWDEDPSSARALSRDTGRLMAAELLALGVDLSFAPVADLGGRSRVIGDRAFHRDPQAVSDLAFAWMQGMHEAGMRAVAKHFPGHGGVTGDTHVERPVDRRRHADLALADLLPFEHLIVNGLDAVMMSHVVYPEVAPEPASFSPRWVTEILREGFDFQGAILADDLAMEGAASGGSVFERLDATLAAGCDLAPLCNDRGAVKTLIANAGSIAPAPASGLRRARLLPTKRWDEAMLRADPRLAATREALARLSGGDSFRLES